MKLKKRKLFSSIAFVLSLVMLMVSGAVFVHSAQQQTATSSLSVTFSGQNVNFEAQGWYHVDGGSRTAMVNNDDTNTGVSFSATDAPNTVRTLKISNTEAENKAVLTSEHPYVLFTYKFVNTASSGAFGMEVSLNITPTPTNLKTIKYASSTSLYTEADLDTFKDSVTGTSTFTNDFIVAGGTSGATSGNSVKYYYILLEVADLTLPVTFNPSFDWTVVCSNEVEGATPLVVGILETGGCSSFFSYQITDASVDTPTGTWYGGFDGWNVSYSGEEGCTNEFLDLLDMGGAGYMWTTIEAGKKIFIRYNGGMMRVDVKLNGGDTVLLSSSGPYVYSMVVNENTAFRLYNVRY